MVEALPRAVPCRRAKPTHVHPERTKPSQLQQRAKTPATSPRNTTHIRQVFVQVQLHFI